jgi:flagellar hook assembly protein FlgD
MFAFELPRAESVQLAIHDVSGRQVRTLMEGTLTAGRHTQIWDGTDDHGRAVAAGMYFARLAAGREHASTSIIVLR